MEHTAAPARSAPTTPAKGSPNIAISLSGGGLRSASFSLGALQVLQERMHLVHGEHRAGRLTSVSGGSYIASTLAIPGDGTFPLARGGPVEDHIRRNSRYLLEQKGGVSTGVIWIAIALLGNLLFVLTAVGLSGWAVGFLYRYAWVTLYDNQGLLGSASLVVGVAGVLVGLGALLHERRVDTAALWGRWSLILVGVGAALGVALVAVPAAITLRYEPTEYFRRGPNNISADAGDASAPPTDGGRPTDASSPANDAGQGDLAPDEDAGSTRSLQVALVSVLGSVAGAVIGGTSGRRQTPAYAALSDSSKARVKSALWKVRVPIANALATVTGPLVLGGTFFWAFQHGSSRRLLWTEIIVVGVAVIALVLAYTKGDVARWSLHPLYRLRLSNCFAVSPAEQSDGNRGPIRHHADPVPLASMAPTREHPIPEIRFCASANVSTLEATPAGSHVLPWIFTPRRIGLSTPVVAGATIDDHPWLCTSTLCRRAEASESLDLQWRTSVQGAAAISAAALSPSMGRMTRSPLRMLLALLNIRLGVWMPNPVGRAGPDWIGAPDVKGRHLRSSPFYLICELLGQNKLKRRWLYVTDGGHYEDLALVEALRCEPGETPIDTVFAVDAGGDPPGKVSTLASAISLARAELGLDLIGGSLDAFTYDRSSRRSDATHEIFTLSSSGVGARRKVTVVVVRLGLTSHTPADLLRYADQYPTFPFDSTANQVYRADRFDAYVALGRDSMNRAIDDWQARQPSPAAATAPTRRQPEPPIWP